MKKIKPYIIPKGNFVYCPVRARAIAIDIKDKPITWPYKSFVGLFRKRCRDNGCSECYGGCRAVNVRLEEAE